MRLLIVTQAVDVHDPLLGFFHRWIQEFAKQVEHVEVICLREGEHALPENVRVHALGKGKLLRAVRFLGLVFSLRRKYDAVFVHMNPEYVVLAGKFWRFAGKRIGLWYTHKNVDTKLRIAEALTHHVFTASKESFRLISKKLHVMGHGIDTDFFMPSDKVREEHLLSVGRLMPSKRHDLAIRTAVTAGRPLRIIGEGPEHASLEALAKDVGASVMFLGALTQDAVRNEYQSAHTLLHTSETGSLDKVVLEALACGTPVVTTSEAYPDAPVSHSPAEPSALTNALDVSTDASERVAYVCQHHSLPKLVPAILAVYSL